ncbi:17997_t:CDS:2, partial [Acaulospora morrowiae]
TIKGVIAPNERMKPEILYIAIAGLAGTIVARNRNILFRIASPLLFTVAASYYFIPQTTRNIAAKIQEHEHVAKIYESVSNTAKESRSKANLAITDLKGDQSKKKSD